MQYLSEDLENCVYSETAQTQIRGAFQVAIYTIYVAFAMPSATIFPFIRSAISLFGIFAADDGK